MKKSILTSFALVLFALGANAQVVTAGTLTTTPSGAAGESTVFTQKVNLVASAVITDGGGGTGGGNVLNEVDFTFDTDNEYTNGISNVLGHQFKINASANWIVQIEPTTSYFTTATPANYTAVAAEKLYWSTNTGSTYTPLAFGAPATIKSGSIGGITAAGNDFKVHYKLDPGYIAHDSYSIVVKYTLTAQ
jgi:hypothetical protein